MCGLYEQGPCCLSLSSGCDSQPTVVLEDLHHFTVAPQKIENRLITHRIHGAIYGNIYHQYTPNVSIYIPYMDPMGYAIK